MILTDLKEARRVQRARCQPLLAFTGLSLPELMETARREHFPELAEAPAVHFVRRGPLACVCCPEGQAPTVYVHEILNRPEVPPDVFRLICLHELLHLRIPAREVDGQLKSHPPEFWRAERALAPERDGAWDWLWRNLGDWFILRKREEGILVRNGWDRRQRRCRERREPPKGWVGA